MRFFRGKTQASAEEPGEESELTIDETKTAVETVPAPADTFDRSSGPFDESEQPDDTGRLDVGALRLPLLEDMEVQLQVDETTNAVTGAFVVLGESGVQIQAFAAPRRDGIWPEVSEEIAAGITEQGGTVDWGYGAFGRELLARVPARQPDGKTSFQPLRFAGVDGPRWLLRAVFHGQAAVDPEGAPELSELVRQLVVVRGSEPMGPRELLPLHLPEGAQVVGEPAAEQPEAVDEFDPRQRGPEITEIR